MSNAMTGGLGGETQVEVAPNKFLAYGPDDQYIGEFDTLADAEDAVQGHVSFMITQTNPQTVVRRVVTGTVKYFPRSYFGNYFTPGYFP